MLAFTDADCLPRPDWLSRGVDRLLAGSGPSFAAGRIQLFPSRPGRPTSAELFELAEGFPQESYVREQGFAATANLLVTRETFDLVGPFRAELQSGGDREWGTRAGSRGVRASTRTTLSSTILAARRSGSSGARSCASPEVTSTSAGCSSAGPSSAVTCAAGCVRRCARPGEPRNAYAARAASRGPATPESRCTCTSWRWSSASA